MAFAFVDEIEELSEQLTPAFLLINLYRFECWSVVLGESVAGRRFFPVLEDVVTFGAIVGVEVTETGKRIHGVRERGRLGAFVCLGKRQGIEVFAVGAAEVDHVLQQGQGGVAVWT